jgi:hypothetical protein
MSQLSHTTGPFECDLSLQKPITVLMTQLDYLSKSASCLFTFDMGLNLIPSKSVLSFFLLKSCRVTETFWGIG